MIDGRVVLVFFLFVLLAPAVANAQWCGLQDIYFQHQPSSDITGYEEWINYPSGGLEVDENITITSANGWVLIDPYITPPGTPDVFSINKGLRIYRLYSYTSTTAGTTVLNVTVFTRNSDGLETKLYSIETGDIEAATTTMYEVNYASPVDLTMAPTDRLVAKVYGKTTSAAAVTLHFVYQGNTHASYTRSGYFNCTSEIDYGATDYGADATAAAFGLVGGLITSILVVKQYKNKRGALITQEEEL